MTASHSLNEAIDSLSFNSNDLTANSVHWTLYHRRNEWNNENTHFFPPLETNNLFVTEWFNLNGQKKGSESVMFFFLLSDSSDWTIPFRLRSGAWAVHHRNISWLYFFFVSPPTFFVDVSFFLFLNIWLGDSWRLPHDDEYGNAFVWISKCFFFIFLRIPNHDRTKMNNSCLFCCCCYFSVWFGVTRWAACVRSCVFLRF